MERLLTTKELARLLKVHESTIYRQVKAGRLPIVRITAGIYRFRWSQVMAALTCPRPHRRLRLVRGLQNKASVKSIRRSLQLISTKHQNRGAEYARSELGQTSSAIGCDVRNSGRRNSAFLAPSSHPTDY